MSAEQQHLTIIFERAADILAQETHLAHGGMFVPAPDPPPAPLTSISLRVVGAYGTTVDLPARVVQVAPSGDLALTFDDPAAARETLTPLFEAARRGAGAATSDTAAKAVWGQVDPAAQASAERAAAADDAEDDEKAGTLHDRIRSMSKPERRQLALRGDRAARLALLKTTDKDIHRFVIQNPALTLDEVNYIAGYRQTHPEVLKRIAANREWVQNPRVVARLVCNPKTPSPLAVRLLDRLPLQEIGRIARSSSTPPAVQAAARRKVIGE